MNVKVLCECLRYLCGQAERRQANPVSIYFSPVTQAQAKVGNTGCTVPSPVLFLWGEILLHC